MLHTTIISEYPTWFLFFCVAIGIVYSYILYGRKTFVFHEKEGKYWKYILAFLRFASTALIAFLLLSLMLKYKRTEEEKPLILLLQDNSSSLDISFGKFPKQKYFTQLNALQQKIQDKYQLISYNFDDQLSAFKSPDFMGNQTDISAAIDELLTRHGSQNIGAVILASDGIFNKGNSPIYNKNTFILPFYTIALGDTVLRKDLMIRSLHYPEIVYMGDQFSMDVEIEANHLQGQSTVLEVTAPEGKVVLSKVIPVTEDKFTGKVTAVGDALKPGISQYKVRLKAIAGEVLLENNYDVAYVEVLDGRQKVLMLYDAPHPDVKAFKNAIEQNKNYQFEQADIKNYTGNFKDADLVILHGLPSVGAAAKYNVLQQLMNTSMPVLWVVSAATNIAQLNTLQTIVQIAGNTMNGNDVDPVFQNSFSKFTLSESALKTYATMPPLLAPFGKYQVSPSADILFKQKIGNITTGLPLVLFNEFNGKKTGVICAEGLWRWRMSEFLQNKNTEATDELINKSIQFLTVKTDKRRFRVHSDKSVYNANDAIQLSAELYNESYQLINDVDVSCVIKGEDGKEYPFIFDKTINAYSLSAGILPVGNYTVKASVNYKGKLNTASCNFSVRQVLVEMLNTRADHNLLQMLAQQSGGKMYAAADMAAIFKDLEQNNKVRSVLYESFTTRPLIDEKWLFVLVLLLLTTEWFIRKYNGSV